MRRRGVSSIEEGPILERTSPSNLMLMLCPLNTRQDKSNTQPTCLYNRPSTASVGDCLRLTATQIVLERLESRIKADRSRALTRCEGLCKRVGEAELRQWCQRLIVRLRRGWTPDTKHSPLIRLRTSCVRTGQPIRCMRIAGRVLMAPSPWRLMAEITGANHVSQHH